MTAVVADLFTTAHRLLSNMHFIAGPALDLSPGYPFDALHTISSSSGGFYLANVLLSIGPMNQSV